MKLNIEKINGDYQVGRITAHDAILRILCTVNPKGNGAELDEMAHQLFDDMQEFLVQYFPGQRSTGKMPNSTQIEAARKWLDRQP